MEEEVPNMDYVKLSSTQYLFLKPTFCKNGMFPIIDRNLPDSFFDLHAICQQRNVIQQISNDHDLGMYGVIGYVEFGGRKASVLVVQTNLERHYETNCSLQLILFTDKSIRNKLGRIEDSTHRITVDGSVDGLSLFIYCATHFIIPGSKGRYDSERIERNWIDLFLASNHILKDGKTLPRSIKRKHVAIMNEKCATKLKRDATIKTISYTEPNRIDVKREKSLKMEATTLSYSDITNSKESSKRTINLREEAVSLVPGVFSENWPPEAYVEGFMMLKNLGLGNDQLAVTSAAMLMDSSYRITDATPIQEDVIENVSIDIDQVRSQYCSFAYLNIIILLLC
jgi:hypothetical protein